MNNSIDLSVFDDSFSSAELPESFDLPDGKYEVTVDTAEIALTKTGKPIFKMVLKTDEGRVLFYGHVFHREGMPYLKRDLKVLGIEPATLSELPEYMHELLDKRLLVRKASKGEFTDVKIYKTLSSDAERTPF